MRLKYCILVMIIGLLLLQCAPSQPKEYIHALAGFKITVPGGWSKTSEDNEMFEFRSGNSRLIEVASLDFGVSTEEMSKLSEQDVIDFLSEFSTEGLSEYCTEANINDNVIVEQIATQWDGKPAYRIRSKGFSTEVDESVIVDMIIMIDRAKARGYLFAAQIVESEYQKIKADIETVIASFVLT